VAEFHEANIRRRQDWPFEMLATATHDTKLGEDVRARINVLSELPEEWRREASRWMRINKAQRTLSDGELLPDRNDEYRFYQAVVGVWPIDLPADLAAAPPELTERLQAYMLKAARESKAHTSWLTPNEDYENALKTFVAGVLGGTAAARFLAAMLPFQRRVAALGMVNSLAQTTLKLGSPGVPDVYQGTELWDLSLVDPDNRRPVDFAQRETLLSDVDALLAAPPDKRAPRLAEWLVSWADARIKLTVVAAGLRLRRERPQLLLEGEYLPLETEVSVSGGLVAFARRHGEEIALFVAPRLTAALTPEGTAPVGADRWKTSRVLLPPALAGCTFRHAITGAELKPASAGDQSWLFAGQIFETVPVGILVSV
jgi:(1->4)-alpha-D-glucan 1-alpha-D-glucosylmutase